MGNRYVEPEFNPLIQTVARLVQRANIATKSGTQPHSSFGRAGYRLFELSENDTKCLFCNEFYEKTLRDKFDFNSFGLIVQHFAYENESFSYTLAEILLKGINRCNYDDVKPYLEAMSYFVTVGDFLQQKRIEWIFGYPQPIVNSMTYGSDSFGIYGNTSLEDLVVSYETPLSVENSTSVLNLILQNRKKFENLCIVCVRQLLLIMDVNYPVFQYVISLPPPSYNCAKFTDWIPAFIDYFLIEAKKYSYSSYSKEEIGLEAQKLWKSIQEKLNNSLESTSKAWEQIYADVEGLKSSVEESKPEATTNEVKEGDAEADKTTNPPLSWIIKPYIVGQTFKEDQLDKRIFASGEIPHEVSLVSTEAQCYITESKAVKNGNLAFPESLLNEARLRVTEVLRDSPFALFIQPRGAYDSSKNPVINDIEAVLKNRRLKRGKQVGKEDEEPEVIEPLLADDDDKQATGERPAKPESRKYLSFFKKYLLMFLGKSKQQKSLDQVEMLPLLLM